MQVTIDLDGTLTQHRDGWRYLHESVGTDDRLTELEIRYHEGKLDFDEWCQANAAVWREHGVTRRTVSRVCSTMDETPGAGRLLGYLHESGHRFGIVSGGLTAFASRFDVYQPSFVRANGLEFDAEGLVAGVAVDVGPDDKGAIVRDLADVRGTPLDECVHVGDSHTDEEAFEVAGTSILFDPDDRIDPGVADTVDVVVEERDLGLVAAELRALVGGLA